MMGWGAGVVINHSRTPLSRCWPLSLCAAWSARTRGPVHEADARRAGPGIRARKGADGHGVQERRYPSSDGCVMWERRALADGRLLRGSSGFQCWCRLVVRGAAAVPEVRLAAYGSSLRWSALSSRGLASGLGPARQASGPIHLPRERRLRSWHGPSPGLGQARRHLPSLTWTLGACLGAAPTRRNRRVAPAKMRTMTGASIKSSRSLKSSSPPRRHECRRGWAALAPRGSLAHARR
jgi:hypothetical protein